MRISVFGGSQAREGHPSYAEAIELGRLLADLDRVKLPLALAAELVDAEQRVIIARRVHNDAVRDTLAYYDLRAFAPRHA